MHYATWCVDQLSLAGFNVIYEPRFHFSTIPAFSSTTSGPIFRAMTLSLFSSASGFAVSSGCFSFSLQHTFHKHLPLNWSVLDALRTFENLGTGLPQALKRQPLTMLFTLNVTISNNASGIGRILVNLAALMLMPNMNGHWFCEQ